VHAHPAQQSARPNVQFVKVHNVSLSCEQYTAAVSTPLDEHGMYMYLTVSCKGAMCRAIGHATGTAKQQYTDDGA